ETAEGRGSGVVRLIPDAADGHMKAWTLLTALDEIKGFEEQLSRSRAKGESYARYFRGPNWLDLRKSAAAYVERDPVVLVVGGGQAGLSIGARLTQLQVDTLIVDREQRIGDNWRLRYHALTLHNQVQVNHLPYMPFPPSWPTYIPKDKLAGWFEAYVESLELNYWPSTEFEGGRYDERDGRWTISLRTAKVTLGQRSSTLIVNIEPSAQLPYALYDEGPSLEDCDLITVATPLELGKKSHVMFTERARKLDAKLLAGLERIGFQLDFGED